MRLEAALASASPLGALKRGYATAAQSTGRLARRVGLLSDAAPPLDHRVRHWLHSLASVHDSLAIAGMDVPWWTYAAIDDVGSWLAQRPDPVRAYEYGSGASTFWLARRAARVHSVEHHRGFGQMLTAELAGTANVTLRIVEPSPSPSPRVGSAKEGCQGLDFTDYVASIDSVEGAFDLIVIDGRAREACLAAALPRLAPDGVIVFDNSRRRRYRRAIESAAVRETRHRGLTPTLPYPDQTSVLRPR